MRKTILLLIILLPLVGVSQIKFTNAKFDNVLNRAKKEKKLVFLNAVSDWCQPCGQMAGDAFMRKDVGDFYNTNFVNVTVDVEKGEGVDLAERFNISVFPTLLFMNGDGVILHYYMGGLTADQFLELGQEAVNPETQMVRMQEKFRNGDRSPELLQRIVSLNLVNNPGLAAEAASYLYADYRNWRPEDVEVVMYLTRNTDSPLYPLFEKNGEVFGRIIGEAAYRDVKDNIIIMSAWEKAYAPVTGSFDESAYNRLVSGRVAADKAANALTYLKMNLALRNRDIRNFEKLADTYYKDPRPFDWMELNSVARNYYRYMDDPESLRNALAWALASIAKKDAVQNNETAALLYFKLGEGNSARNFAEKAVALARQTGETCNEAQQLLRTLK